MTKEQMMRLTPSSVLVHAMLQYPCLVDEEVNDHLKELACEEQGIEKPEDGFLWTPSHFGTKQLNNPNN